MRTCRSSCQGSYSVIDPPPIPPYSPTEMLMGRHLHTHLDLMRPDVSTQVRTKQGCQKTLHDLRARERHLFTQSLLAILVLVRSCWQVQLSLSRVNPVR